MELEELQVEAKLNALEEIKMLLVRPGHLEKLDRYKNRTTRKKASLEAQLKTAMQNQLESIRVGDKQLRRSINKTKEINDSIIEVDDLLLNVPHTYECLEPVKDLYTRHSQYATAIENLNHIFTIQKSVARAMELIEADKLLQAHQCLVDMENARDDILFELYNLPEQYASNKMALKQNFAKLETVSSQLAQKIQMTLKRCLTTVRIEPTIIVTALRVVQREEKADEFAIQHEKRTGFISPDRPKEWRKLVMDVLWESVLIRIESSKLEERNTNKLWLFKNLEIARQFILEDLRVVKTLCVPCFPPEYDIFNEYIKMYHIILSKHLEEIIENGLEGNEYFTLLFFVMNVYPGPELMGHPELNINLDLAPLINEKSLKELENAYLKIMEKNYEDWMTKTVESEKSEWFTDKLPEYNGPEEYYQTSAPVILFEMISQHLDVTNTIHSRFVFNALILSIQQLINYGNNYRHCIIEFKEKHFKDRSQMPLFTQHIITIVNNCQQIIELIQEMKQRYWPKSQTEHYEDYEELLKLFQNLRDEVASFLLEEAFLDLEIHFTEIFTSKWLSSSRSVDTICITLEDYFQDYNHLRKINFEYVINEAQNMIVRRYIRAMLSKRISKSRADCEKISNKICKEAKQIKDIFTRIAPNMSDIDSPIALITTLSNLLNCDVEMLILDLHPLLGNFPSLSEDHLLRLFYTRYDIKSSNVRSKIQDALKSKKTNVNIDKRDEIFKRIIFSDKLW